MSFSVVPLRFAARVGTLISAAGFIGIILVILRKMIRPQTAIGWPSILVSILFFTGILSRPFAARGEFRTARALLLFPSWMEHYHPEDLAYLDAGILYEDGKYTTIDLDEVIRESNKLMKDLSDI